MPLSRPELAGGSMAFDVEVKNLTGHKFPTGYPARRTWLHVTVRDATAARCSSRARLAPTVPSPATTATRTRQVRTALRRDHAGRPGAGLRAHSRRSGRQADHWPSTDADFTDAGDRVRYRASVAGATGPFKVEVELRYQSIGYRWASNLEKYDAPEPKRFVGYYRAMAQTSSELVARVVLAP